MLLNREARIVRILPIATAHFGTTDTYVLQQALELLHATQSNTRSLCNMFQGGARVTLRSIWLKGNAAEHSPRNEP